MPPTPPSLTLPEDGCFVGRIWHPELRGPSLVCLRDGAAIDITTAAAPTMRDLLELETPADHVTAITGTRLGDLQQIVDNTLSGTGVHLLAPNDLQAVKACSVTFARSMVERVIEERAAGDPAQSEAIRAQISGVIGDSLRNIKAGSDKAAEVKEALCDMGLWSQYVGVGIGPDAEVFSKAQPMASVCWGARVGLHPVSAWNNPEPEIVLACASTAEVKGASLGNDVNLRDVEGRSALLLGKAKDNTASCAIGPFIRLFDDSFGMQDVRHAQLDKVIEELEGYRLDGHSAMTEISRDPLDLVAQTCGGHHQYPDGFMLFLGKLFAPTQDRDVPGEGFTHKTGDIVTIRSAKPGSLRNEVALSPDFAPWTFGASHLMRNLALRGLL
ncbi:fumarylacetoacetate hydrolase family protein [Roseobacter weihaiensis]|uniref:fumarylacetoacetate hydrolase family protein n=1 Tax=Roseobacter weihaiensis TaxID=2763262 RepID=UPI001D0A277B|nr:fumarylacetoacetate hydrolase family protein [Roseobacter sp. H9]